MSEGTGRVEAFSDGVFAIAITLLILELHVPTPSEGGSLRAALLGLWPSYLAFALSFFVVLVIWVNHHELLRLVREISYPFLFANGFVLFTVTFVPFPTAVLAQHLRTTEAPAATAFYCGTFVFYSLAWCLLLSTIVRGGLFREDVGEETVRRIRHAYATGPVLYAVAAIVAILQPVAGLALNASLWLLWIRLAYRSPGKGAELRRLNV
jgi:uncharacterized membrane protein